MQAWHLPIHGQAGYSLTSQEAKSASHGEKLGHGLTVSAIATLGRESDC